MSLTVGARDKIERELRARVAELETENDQLRALIGPGEVLASFPAHDCRVVDNGRKALACADDWLFEVCNGAIAEAETAALQGVDPQPVDVTVIVRKRGG